MILKTPNQRIWNECITDGGGEILSSPLLQQK